MGNQDASRKPFHRRLLSHFLTIVVASLLLLPLLRIFQPPLISLPIYSPVLVKLPSRYPNGKPGCLKKPFPPPAPEPLSHHRCRLSLGPGPRPHVRIAPDLLPELSWPPRRRLASSWPECGRRLAHGL